MTDLDDNYDQLDPASFERVATFIKSVTGIKLPAAKKPMLEGRLRRRTRALGLDSLAAYVAAVFDDDSDEEEAINLIDAVTTNKTDFFREPAHFEFLTQSALPELLSRHHGAKFWSAACSIGAEPYTLAMVLSDFALSCGNFRFSILASDISTDVLNQAARAIYSEEMIKPVPLAMRQRYLLRSINPGKMEVRMAPEIRHLVNFARINLIDAPYPVDHDMDVIFCRNLLIYFDRETQEKVIRHLCGHLRNGGYLILGHTDSVTGMALPLEWLGKSIFRRH